jgi:DNA-binding NarL/FixJ family response regulator
MAEGASRDVPAGGEGQGTILVVEDDERWQEMLSGLLTRRLEGVTVETADDVAAATRLIEGNRYTCYICDYALPDGDGLEVLLAARDRHPDVPFVLVTGRGSEQVASEAIRAGVTDYIIKNRIDARGDLLVNRVENAVSEYRARNTLRRERQLKSAITEIVGDSGRETDVFTEFCRQLIENTAYDCAWIAIEDESGTISSHAHAGMGEYAERVLDAADLAGTGEPTVRALETDSFVEFPPADESMESALDSSPDWLAAARACGVTRVLAVPIRYDGLTHGALGVYATGPIATDDTRMLTEYADFVAFAFQTAQWKQSLLSEDPLCVEFLFEDPPGPYRSLVGELPEDSAVEVDSIVHRTDAPDRYLLTVDGADPGAVAAAAERVPGVAPIAVGGNRPRHELAIEGETPEDRLGQHGAEFERTRLAGDTAVVTASVPNRADVPPLLEALQSAYGEVSVRMMKQGEPEGASPHTPLEPLTDRQRETLEYAFYAGFFDRPQAATAGEIAEAFGVSSSTVLYHLRTAERKLLASVFTTL